LVTINPLQVLLWTFRRNEKDVVNLYDTLSDVMGKATGSDMLNFGYWTDDTKEPLQAQMELCNIFAKLADLSIAKTVVDMGSGLSAPAIQWKSSFPDLKITCLNINWNQLTKSKDIIKKSLTNHSDISVLNGTSTSLPFPDRSIDRVLALESAQHLKPLSEFLSESKRILQDDGILALAIPVVSHKINPITKLGVLSVTWSSEHYTTDFIESSLDDAGFETLEEEKIGSLVYPPLADYYSKNRDMLKPRILSKYPSYLEGILFKSLLKMKQVSESNIIDYLLIKCRKKN